MKNNGIALALEYGKSLTKELSPKIHYLAGYNQAIEDYTRNEAKVIEEVLIKIVKKMSISKQILMEELNNNEHPEKVEDVIYWALEYYCENRKKGTWGETIAYAIKQRILDAEKTSTEPRER